VVCPIYIFVFRWIIVGHSHDHATDHRPDGADSKKLWNVGKILPDCTVLQPADSHLQG
jgi:hypothetical protein